MCAMKPAFESVEATLTERTGLALTAPQRADLAKVLEGRLRTLGLKDEREYLQLLGRPEELRAVLDALTVRETFFFRHEAQFEAISRTVLPELLARARSEGRKARLWSAGCCTGEEPYTLAILAAEAGRLDDVEILASDIHEGSLEAAMRGVYSRRSVETVPAALLPRYFSRRGAAYVLDEALRRRVVFKALNLSEPCFPSFLNQTSGQDLILCRNTLIYFDRARASGILARLTECLRPGGVLALGSSEVPPSGLSLATEQIGQAFLYRRPPQADRPPAPRPPPPGRAPGSGEDPEDLLRSAESLADAGRTAEAAALCRRAAELKPLDARAHYLMGLLEAQRPDRGYEHFRRVVYLNPRHLLARFHLALCAGLIGRGEESSRGYRNVERLAASRPPEELADAKEGISCGMLALICRQAGRRAERGDGS